MEPETIEYVGGVGPLNVGIGFNVRGGQFDFKARLEYPNSGWPTSSITYLEA
ncbi:MAG: hypothetical protein JKY37_33030 [Nannocystaceae bacterium]|nr:hypothetical protein [Nannocystaceae bacterium]